VLEDDVFRSPETSGGEDGDLGCSSCHIRL
jgi:hypothetical protein